MIHHLTCHATSLWAVDRSNDPVEEIASFMCRSRREIREKIAELERSGEFPGLIEKAAPEAVDEPEDDNDTLGETAT